MECLHICACVDVSLLDTYLSLTNAATEQAIEALDAVEKGEGVTAEHDSELY